MNAPLLGKTTFDIDFSELEGSLPPAAEPPALVAVGDLNNSRRLAAWIRLSMVSGLSSTQLHKILTFFGSAEAMLDARPSLLEFVSSVRIARAVHGVNAEYINRVLTWLNEPNHHIICWDDARYPQRLLRLPDPPTLLYAIGNPDLLNREAIAVVGSRNCSPQGATTARQFAQALGDAGLTVVSGLALGIDAAAHQGALQSAASTIAVVGTGVDRIYPARNHQLADDIATKGIIISEFTLGTPPLGHNFPRRNRIIAGLGKGVVVVEASPSSGSLITAKLANEYGSEVFAIPGSIHSPFARGCHRLIKEGAKLVESANDVLDEMKIPRVAAPVIELPPEEFVDDGIEIPISLDPGRIVQYMGYDPITVDAICAASGATADLVVAELLSQELNGMVQSLPGGLYQRIK